MSATPAKNTAAPTPAKNTAAPTPAKPTCVGCNCPLKKNLKYIIVFAIALIISAIMVMKPCKVETKCCCCKFAPLVPPVIAAVTCFVLAKKEKVKTA